MVASVVQVGSQNVIILWVVQWLLDKSVSEFNYMHDDSAHYVILIFPGNVRYVILLTSDMETCL